MYYDENNLLRKNTKYFEFSLQTHIRHANVRRYITHTANWRIPNLVQGFGVPRTEAFGA